MSKQYESSRFAEETSGSRPSRGRDSIRLVIPLIVTWALVALIAVALFQSWHSPEPTKATKSIQSSSAAVGPSDSIRLACRSIELYDRFSGEFFANGLLLPKLSKQFQENFSFGDGTGKNCMVVVDNDPARLEYLRNQYHVEKTAPGYSCIRHAKDSDCWWTATDKLRYIGHGPQLTDEQFAQVQAMRADVDALDKKAREYFERSLDIAFDQTGHSRKNLSERERREMYELQDLGTETSHKALQLETRARSFGH